MAFELVTMNFPLFGYAQFPVEITAGKKKLNTFAFSVIFRRYVTLEVVPLIPS